MKKRMRFLKTTLCLTLSMSMLFSDMGISAAASEAIVEETTIEEMSIESIVEETTAESEPVKVTESENDKVTESEAEKFESEESRTEAVAEEVFTEDRTEAAAEEVFTEDRMEAAVEEVFTEEMTTEKAYSGIDVQYEDESVGESNGYIVPETTYDNITWSIDSGGNLTVAGTGDFTTSDYYNGKNAPWYEYNADIKTAKVDIKEITRLSNMFKGCYNLTSVDLDGLDTSNVISMSGMFAGCNSLTDLDLSGLDTSNVKYMESMFRDCNSLVDLDLNGLDTNNVENMESMFRDCNSLADLDLSELKADSVTSMEYMFSGCGGLKSLNLSGINAVNVKYMDSMFENCINLENLDLEGFNASNAENMYGMFNGCSSLVNLNLKGFKANRVRYMHSMFRGCSSLMNLDLSSFETGNVEDMSSMFEGCSSLQVLDLGSFKTGNVTDMSGMFNGCSNLNILDLSNFKTGNVTQMYEMFLECTGLTNLNLNGFDTRKVKAMNEMFSGCNSLKSLDLSGFKTDNVIDMYYMFNGCGSLESLDLTNFKTDNATSMKGMFNGCSSLESLDLSSFKTDNATSMEGMFNGCNSLRNLDLSGFNTAKVECMRSMFNGCNSLESLDLSGFDTEKVTDMNSMFSGCSSIENLDLSNFKTNNVTYMASMFSGCNNLGSLDLSSFDTRKVDYIYWMFDGCSSLESLDLSSFDLSNCNDVLYFDGCTNLISLHTPRNVKSWIGLPAGTWYDAKGNKYTGSLQDITDSILITRDEIPTLREEYIKASKTTTTYKKGATISLDDLIVDYYNGEGTKITLSQTDYITNVSDIDTETSGTKTLTIKYKNMTTDIFLTIGGDVHIEAPDVKDVVYTKIPAAYTGAVKATAEDGTDITDEIKGSLLYTYRGSNDTVYAESQTAPIDAGTYELVISVTSDNPYYTGTASFPFTIKKAKVTITADSISLKLGDSKPGEYKYTISSPATEDDLETKPTITCDISDTSKAGEYEIKISGAKLKPNQNFEPDIDYKSGRLEVTAYYTVTFNKSGKGADDKQENIKSGSTISRPADPSAEGFTFTGWYKESGCTTLWDFSNDKVDSDITLYAGWTEKDDDKDSDTDDTDNTPDDRDDSVYDTSERKDLSSIAHISEIKSKVYDGYAYEPDIRVTADVNGKRTTLTEGTDYRVLYKNNINKGTATATVKGNGMYRGTLTTSFTINAKPMSALKIVTGGVSLTASTAEIAKAVYVYDTTGKLENGKDFTVTGTASQVIVTGIGNYTGSKTVKLTTYNVDSSKIINADNVKLSQTTVTYTGKAIKTVEPTVTIGTVTLIKNKDYKVSYQNNKNVGDAFVIVTGKGAYKGKAVVPFKIMAQQMSAGSASIAPISDRTYNGRLQKPALKVTVNGKKLTKSKDYTVAFKNNLHAGKSTVIITGKGNYAGLKAQTTFMITPQQIKKAVIKGTQGNITLTYNKRTLKEGADYEKPVYGSAGSRVTVTIKGIGDFTGTVTKSIKR